MGCLAPYFESKEKHVLDTLSVAVIHQHYYFFAHYSTKPHALNFVLSKI